MLINHGICIALNFVNVLMNGRSIARIAQNWDCCQPQGLVCKLGYETDEMAGC